MAAVGKGEQRSHIVATMTPEIDVMHDSFTRLRFTPESAANSEPQMATLDLRVRGWGFPFRCQAGGIAGIALAGLVPRLMHHA